MNHLLQSLPASDLAALAPTDVTFSRGDVLADVGRTVTRLIFPHSLVVSGVMPLADGSQPDTGVIGCEGVVGFESLWGWPHAVARWTTQVGGVAAVVDAPRARAVIGTLPAAHVLLAAFSQALLTQVMRTVACNAAHAAEQRLARWLLLCVDRIPGRNLTITHDFLAQMLGMARPRVTVLLRGLQQAGLIVAGRGGIAIIDRDGLAARSCECYGAVLRAYQALLPHASDCGNDAERGL